MTVPTNENARLQFRISEMPLVAMLTPVAYPLDALPDTIRNAAAEVQGFTKAPVSLSGSIGAGFRSQAASAATDPRSRLHSSSPSLRPPPSPFFEGDISIWLSVSTLGKHTQWRVFDGYPPWVYLDYGKIDRMPMCPSLIGIGAAMMDGIMSRVRHI